MQLILGPNYQAKEDFKIKPFASRVLADSGCSRSILPYSLIKEKNLRYVEAIGEELLDAQDNQMNIIGKLHIQASFEKNSTLMDCLISNAVDEVIVSWYDSTSLGLHLAIEKASKIISERKDGKNSPKRASQEELIAKSLILTNDKNDTVLS